MILARLLALAAVLAALPSALRAEDWATTALPVPAATIYPGEVIRESALSSRMFRTTPRSLLGIARTTSDTVGKESRRRLLAGKPIPLAALSEPVAVRRGAMATAVYGGEGFVISTQLVALADGTAGDVIDARNPATGIVIKARVLSSGELEVTGE